MTTAAASWFSEGMRAPEEGRSGLGTARGASVDVEDVEDVNPPVFPLPSEMLQEAQLALTLLAVTSRTSLNSRLVAVAEGVEDAVVEVDFPLP